MCQFRVLLNAVAVLFFYLFIDDTAYAGKNKNDRYIPTIPASTFMGSGAGVAPPLGHAMFCRKHPADCRGRTGSKKKSRGRVRLTSENWRQLMLINAKVNRSIISRSDKANHGVLDRWSLYGRYGDCEDYALRKRKMLISLGWPSSSVLVTTARDHKKRPHAVLLVRTSKGDYILDNLTSRIRPWRRVPYQWLKRQSARYPKKWVALASYRKQLAKPSAKTKFRNKAEAAEYLQMVLKSIRKKNARKRYAKK